MLKFSVCNHDLPPLEYFSFIKIFRLNKIAATPDWVKCLVIKVLKNETLNLLPKIFDLSRTVLKLISELGQSMAEKFGKIDLILSLKSQWTTDWAGPIAGRYGDICVSSKCNKKAFQ